jgi:hypothetical protein
LVLGSPRAPFVVAPLRDDAVFAAKTFLAGAAGPSPRSEFTNFASDDSVYAFLREQLGRDGAERRALADVRPWAWSIRSLSAADRSEWTVVIAPNGKPVGFRRTIADTVSGAKVSMDSARALATSALSSLGWNVATLRPISDSTIPRKARTDYLFRWATPGAAIKWRADSAYDQLSVWVAGNQVTRVVPALRMPEGYRSRDAGGMVGTVLVIFFIGIVASIVGIVRRQPVDELQWKMMLRVLALLVAIAIVGYLAELPETIAAMRAGVGTPFSQMIVLAIGFAVLAAGGVCVAVAGESIAHKHFPEVGAGLSDLARGRVFLPEVVAGVSYGYAVGAVMALVTGLMVFVTQILGIGRPVFPPFPFGTLPFSDAAISSIIAGLALPFAALFVWAIVRSIRVLSKAAVFVPAALVGAVHLMNSSAGTTTAVAMVTAFLLTVALARFGLLAAMLAVMFAFEIERIVSLVQAADAHDLLHGAALVVLFLLPGVVAMVAYRRLAAKRAIPVEATTGGAA